jgi:hypothetical protein
MEGTSHGEEDRSADLLMGVTRTALPFEKDFTQIPNAWLRDARLSRKARGLLGEIMSHQVGWRVTIRGLAAIGPEGKDSVEAGLKELRACGYLVLSQARAAGGQFGEGEYELVDPFTVSGFSGSGSAASGSAVSGKPAPIRTPSVRTPSEEETPSLIAGDEPERIISLDQAFALFWAVWPRKKSRDDAHRAFGVRFKALPARDRPAWVDDVVAGVARARAEWEREGRSVEKVPYPATWLRAGGWTDVPDPAPVLAVDEDKALWRSGRRVN